MRKSLGRVKGYNWQPSFLTKHGEISQDTGASFDSIKVGMTINEVEAILAKATSKIEEIYGFMKLWAMDDGSTIAGMNDRKGKISSTSRGEN